jgi:hypothetical protein
MIPTNKDITQRNQQAEALLSVGLGEVSTNGG